MNIKVNFYSISPSRITVGTKGSYGTSVMNFTFSDEWKHLTKKVTFYPPNADPVSVIMLDDSVVVPVEVMKSSGESKYVISGYRDNKTLISLEGTVIVLKTLDPSEVESTPPTPSEMAQILEMMQTAVNAVGGNEIVHIARAKEAAVSAENAARNANVAAEKAERAAEYVDNSKSLVSDLVTKMNEKMQAADTVIKKAENRASEAQGAAQSANEAAIFANNAVAEANMLINKLNSAYIFEDIKRVKSKEIKNTVEARPNYIVIYGKSVQENPSPTYTNPSPVINVVNGKVVFKNKNLFTGENLFMGAVLSYSGNYLYFDDWCVTDFIPVKENSDYITSGYGRTSGISNGGVTFAICFYDENRNHIGFKLHYGEKETRFKTPNGCRYVRDTMLSEAISTYQLEPGVFSSSYEPCEADIAVLNGYSLCSLYNKLTFEEFADTIEVSANRVLYTKRVGAFTTKSTDVYLTSGNMIYLPVTDHKIGEDFTGLCAITASDNVKYVDPYRIGMFAYYAGFMSVNDALNYLYQNPTTFYYPLREPIVQDITNTAVGQQLLSLRMRNGCTTVESDAELDMQYLIDSSMAYKNFKYHIENFLGN